MKLRNYENLIRKSKAATAEWLNTTKIDSNKFYYDNNYCLQDPHAHTWWDDGFFVYGSHLYNVDWYHPSFEYRDHAARLADAHLKGFPREQRLSRTFNHTPKRRKITLGSVPISSGLSVGAGLRPVLDSNREYFTERRNTEEIIKLSSDFQVFPYWSVHQCRWGKLMKIVCPHPQDMAQWPYPYLLHLGKDLITGKVNLKQLFPNYSYGKTEYMEQDNEK